MTRISEFVLTFLINAAWQITVITVVAWICARLLSNVAARYRHGLWVAALLLSVALPLWSLFSFTETMPTRSQETNTEAFGQPNAAPQVNSAPAPTRVGTNEKSNFSTYQLYQRRRQSVSSGPAFLLALGLAYASLVCYRGRRLWLSWRRTQILRGSVYDREIPSRMKEVEQRCRTAFGLRNVRLVCSPTTQTPVTVGTRGALIVLPESFYRDLPDNTICSVLGHEMAHIARRDFILNLLYEFCLLPIAFHPLARLIKRQIDRTRELACDEMVTERLLEPEVHARSLVIVASSLIAPADQAFMLGIFDANILEERIMKLTRRTRRLGLRAGRLLTLTAISILCFSCLAISTFSFELTTAHRNSADVNEPSVTEVTEYDGGQTGNQIATTREEPQRPTAVERKRELSSASSEARAQAACEAGKQRALDLIPMLISMLGDDSKTEFVHCWTLGRWNPALATFKQPSPGEQAAIALASMGSPAFEPLTNELGNSNASVRRNAAWAIGELTNMIPYERADAVMPLISLLNDPDSWVRMAASRALGELRDERAGLRLNAALLDSEAGVRQISAWALGEMKDERAVQSLCNLLVSDTQVEVRLAAAEALGEIRSQKAMASLNQALNDSEPRVRARVKWAISEIEDTDG